MSAIRDFLNKLATAIYGEDVRWSIHDAIEQCYKDATGHPDSVAAVVEQNNEMADLLENTPYTTALEDEGVYELPIHTINDKDISRTSTWSSTKINTEIATRIVGNIIEITGEETGISLGSFTEVNRVIGTSAELGSPEHLQVIFAGQDQQSRYESPSGDISQEYLGIYNPMVYSQQEGMDGEQVSSTVVPTVNSITQNDGNITISFSLCPADVETETTKFYDIKYRVVLMRLP